LSLYTTILSAKFLGEKFKRKIFLGKKLCNKILSVKFIGEKLKGEKFFNKILRVKI